MFDDEIAYEIGQLGLEFFKGLGGYAPAIGIVGTLNGSLNVMPVCAAALGSGSRPG